MSVQIITVTLEDQRIDCKVQGSPLSVAQYANAIALAINCVAGIFESSSSKVTKEEVLEALLTQINEVARVPIKSETHLLN